MAAPNSSGELPTGSMPIARNRSCTSGLRTAARGGATDELADLTAQERKILLLVAEGKTNKEIAADVFLSDKTVKNYVSSILSKLNLQRRTQAAAFVAKHHLGEGPTGN